HTASRGSSDLLVAEGIGTLCIGTNPLCKQHARLGRRANEHVVQVPHARFIALLTYQAEQVGNQVKSTEERSTSKTSFLDGDPLLVDGAAATPAFSGRRMKRGLSRAADGRHLTAEVNGSYNVIHRVLPDACVADDGKGRAGAAGHSVRLPVRTKRVA